MACPDKELEVNTQQRTDEWFTQRRGRITASQVGAILGNSPYADAEDVMRRMVREYHSAEPEFTGNVATEYGTYHEAGALADYRMETGLDVEECGFIVPEGDDWAGCSPDGLLGFSGVQGGLEIKCPYSMRDGKGEFKQLAEQPHYYDQVQFSLWITGREFWHFFQWCPKKTKLQEVFASDAWQARNLPILRQFYARYLHEREHDFQKHLEPKRVVIDTIEAYNLVREHDELAEAIDNAKARQSEIMERLIKLAKERDAEVAGHKLTKVTRKGNVSYAKVIKEHLPNLDLEPYRGKAPEYWKLS